MKIFLSLLSILVCSVYAGIWIYIILADIIEKIHKNKSDRDLFNKVQRLSQDKDLIRYIIREQNIHKLENDYCINFSNDEENQFINGILETHKKSVIDSYFSNSLKKDKMFYALTFQEYYLYSLYCFLNDNMYNSQFDIKLHKYVNSENRAHIYSLTSHGIIYYKLYIVVSTYCNSNKNLSELAEFEYSIFRAKDDIDEGTVTVWHYLH